MNFRQKLQLFSDIYVRIDIMMGMVREDTLTTYFGSTWSRGSNRKADTSTEEVVNQNGDINEWERRGIFLIIFNTPVLPVGTTKINYS